jgi:hypothetical protein
MQTTMTPERIRRRESGLDAERYILGMLQSEAHLAAPTAADVADEREYQAAIAEQLAKPYSGGPAVQTPAAGEEQADFDVRTAAIELPDAPNSLVASYTCRCGAEIRKYRDRVEGHCTCGSSGLRRKGMIHVSESAHASFRRAAGGAR